MTEHEKTEEILRFCKAIYNIGFLYHLLSLAAIGAGYFCCTREIDANFNKRLDLIEAKINRIDSLSNLKNK